MLHQRSGSWERQNSLPSKTTTSATLINNEDEEDRIFKQLLHPEKESNKIGAILSIVPTLYGLVFCWERGLQPFLALTFIEISSQILLNIIIQRFAANLTQFSVINIFRIPIVMSVQFFMYWFYGPLVPYHVFSVFRILFASHNCYYDVRLLLLHGLGNLTSTVGGMYYSYLLERHKFSKCEENMFSQKMIEVIVLEYLVWMGSVLFSHYLKKRNEEFTENQIVIAKEKYLNNEKTQFIANLSHEARNSLQGIMATVEVLKHKFHDGICMKSCEHCFKKDSAISELIGDIQSSASLLLHILSSSLQMSSLEMGKIKLKNEEFNILSLFESMTGVFSLEAQGKNLSLNSFFDASKVPLNLKGDSVRVSQILMNIISNAIKYTSQGFVRVNCSSLNDEELVDKFEKIDSSKVYVKFECIDSGCGIAQDQIGKLFQPYHTIDPNTDVTHRFDFYFKTASNISSDNNAGSSLINTNRNGLGLNITKLLVEKMNGKIEIVSEPSKGTTVTVILPMEGVKAPPNEGSQEKWPLNTSQILHDSLSTSDKIMAVVIDENRYFRETLKQYLGLFKRVNTVLEFDTFQQFSVDWDHASKPSINNVRTLIFCMEGDLQKISHALLNGKGEQHNIQIIPTILRGATRSFNDKTYLSKPVHFHDLVEVLREGKSDEEALRDTNEHKAHTDDFSVRSVLLADDNAVNRKILVNMLKIIGFKDIDTASDGLDCFNKFKTKEYSLVLLDCFMPVMTGRESCEMIRNFDKQRENGEKRVPIFAITANTWETKEQLLSQGFDDVLYKPITLNDLKQKVMEVLLLPLVMSIQFLMYFYYGPFIPYHAFGLVRMLFAANNCFYSNMLFIVHGYGLMGSILVGMVVSFMQEKEHMKPYEITLFYHRLVEVFVLQHLVWIGAFLFTSFAKKRNEEYTENVIEFSKEKILNAEKTQFIANLSHEARNSLQGIMATVEVLNHKFHDGVCMKSCEHCFKKDSAISELIGDIQSSASLLLHILSSSLQMSSLEMGKIKLKNEEFNILSLFESMTGVFSLEAQGKNLSLNSFFDASKVPLNLKGDSVRVSQILMNIISNAIKYTSQGFVRVNCSSLNDEELVDKFEKIDSSKVYVKFECIDSGCGIAQDQIGKLFQPYHTIDPNTDVTHKFDFYFKTAPQNASTNNGGSSLINTNRNGLGLSITKLLVEKMNGKIFIASTVSKGTTLTVIIPFEVVKGVALKKETNEPTHAHNLPRIIEDTSKECVAVIIDDDDCFRDALKSYLTIFKRVVDVYQYASPIEYFNHVQSSDPNLPRYIFCGDGSYDTIYHQVENIPNVKIIPTLFRGTTRSHPNKKYLSKPIHFADIVGILDEEEHVTVEPYKVISQRRNSVAELSAKSVLMADDNAVNRKILVNMLKIIGFKDIDTANDGLDCFNKFKKKEYSLVLLDCFMPVMTGRESCEMIRNFEKQRENGEKRVPIFAITANTWETKEQLLSQGFDDVLYKPISLNDLKNRIMEMIS
ncbi:hypothetical protein C9374_011085 [Naegleria lovaniensis]|uniref:histidine kinase n=1 Tax=Naegleria lovaniensis TaxID=51637 RepID=A0AA88GG35_NAELO|nr:uncharacterized protein C9374_011085 [Naegleria lovaniensis]KAG2374248.1 hypothetical protein C9374_011085 [Naegleria lovaniensis]